MNCAEFEKRLQTAVERRLPMSGGSLREHASHCARCGELWQEAVFLERVIEAWAAEVKSANLTDGVLRRLTAEEARAGRLASDAVPVRPAELTVVALTRPDATGRSERIRGRTARAVVAAVAVVVAALLLLPASPGPQPGGREGPMVAAGREARPIEPAESLAAPPPTSVYEGLQTLVEQTQSSYLAVSLDDIDVLPDWTQWLRRPSQKADREQPRAEWTREVRQGLTPIQRDVTEALHILYKALPVRPPRTS